MFQTTNPFLFSLAASFLLSAHMVSSQIELAMGTPINQVNQFVEVLNYPTLDKVLRHEKLEIGAKLYSNIEEKVNNFVTKSRVPEESLLNPYLDWELRVFAEFTQEGVTPIVVDGFYTKDFQSWSPKVLPKPLNKDNYSHEEYKKVGGWEEMDTHFPFRIRFAPPTTGEWSVVVKVQVRGEEVAAYPAIYFQVIASENKGYVKVSDEQRFLEQGGRTFFPIGCNLAWPETDSISDPDLFNNLCYYDKNSNTYYRSNEGYRANFAAPRVYENYKEMMTELSDNGANYMRTIMYPSATDIEWEKVGDYTDRLAMAQELDAILEHAENEKLFLHWNMQIHYSLQFSASAYYRAWSWDAKYEGLPYGYRALLNTDNPVDFLSDETAKKYYKQRLRYILSRWGYSTNIAVWELFSEITNVGAPGADHSGYYQTGENWKIYRDWQVEMAKYLKTLYYGQVHLVTASFGGPKHPKDDTFQDPSFDVMTSNIYDFGAPDFASFWTNTVSKHYLHDISATDTVYHYESYSTDPVSLNYVRKPMLYSETDPLGSLCDERVIEGRRAMWQALFSGLAGALSWDFRLHPNEFTLFKEMRLFTQQVEMMQDGWHPGSTLRDESANWKYNEYFAKGMDPMVEQRFSKKEKSAKADVVYLRSADGNFAFGVISNKTFNVASVDSCFSMEEWPEKYTTLNTAESIQLKKESLRIRGLSKGRFTIEYYLPSNPYTPIGQSERRGEELKLDLTVPASNNEYIILFKAHRNNYSWKTLKLEK